MNQGGTFRNTVWLLVQALAGPVLLWGILFLVIPPGQQEFPLNDDWAYSRGAFDLARGDGIHYYGWPFMPLLGQWLWAFPFIRILGESHVVLRLSTVTLSLLGSVAFVALLRMEGVSRHRAALAASVLALNPLFCLCAGTFMADIPALSFSLIALALYVRALRTKGILTVAAAAAVTVLAVTTRQNTIAVTLAAAVLLWQTPSLRFRPLWILSIVGPAIICVATQLWFLSRTDIVRNAYGSPSLLKPLFLFLVAAHWMGLATLPMLVFCPFTKYGSLRRWGIAVGGLTLAIVAWYLSSHGMRLFPYTTNMITVYGAFSVGDVVVGDRPLLMGLAVRYAIALLGCIAGATLLVRCRRLPSGPLVWFTAAHVAILLASPWFFDRYLIPLIPGALALAVGGAHAIPRAQDQEPPAAAGRARTALAFSALFALGFISLALVHDWWSWNAARWAVGRRALARGLDALDIEGGFEWDGWFSPKGAAPISNPVVSRGFTLPLSSRLFVDLTGRYALAFSVPPGTRALDEEPYRLWLVPGEHRFYLIANSTDSSATGKAPVFEPKSATPQ